MTAADVRSLVIGTLGSMAAAGLIAVGVRAFGDQSAQVAVLGSLTSLSVGAVLVIGRNAPRRIAGREAFMKRNLRSLKREAEQSDKNDITRVDCTRFAKWPVPEKSLTRIVFRNELDDAAAGDVRLRRIHNLVSEDDKDKLLYEVRKYTGQDKVSLRVLFGLDTRLLPELLVTSGYASWGPASQRESVMGSGFLFRRRAHVELIEAYFEGIWAMAEPAMSRGKPVDEVVRWVTEWVPE